jgi:hypothetical protein
MKTGFVPSANLEDVLLYGVVYLLWFLNALICAAVVIQLQSTSNVIWIALGGDRYSLGLVNQVCLLLGGFVAFVYVMSLEGYYRDSITRRDTRPERSTVLTTQQPTRLIHRLNDSELGRLLRRFAIATAIPIGVLVACLVALEIALRVLQ